MTLALDAVTLSTRRKPRLEPLTLSIPAGVPMSVIGPKGAGKSTLMALIAGIERPTAGSIKLDGRVITREPPRRRRVAMLTGFVADGPAAGAVMLEGVAAPVAATGRRRLFGKRPSPLEARRASLKRVLASGARLILLDEPLSGLDDAAAETLLPELVAGAMAALARPGTVLVLATARGREALRLGGDAIVLDQGRVPQSGPVGEVCARPANRRIAELAPDPPMNFFTAYIEAAGARTLYGEPVPMAWELRQALAPSCMVGFHVGAARFGERPRAALSVLASILPERLDVAARFIRVEAAGGRWIVPAPGLADDAGEVVIHVADADFFIFDAAGNLAAQPASD